MTMKKLVLYLELGFLCCTVLVLVVSSLDRREPAGAPTVPPPETTRISEPPAIDLPAVEPLIEPESVKPPAVSRENGLVVLRPTWKKQTKETVLNQETALDDDLEAEEALLWHRQTWKGDLDGMRKRRVIRALVPFSRTFFFLDRGRKRGLTYDTLMEYEKFLNRRSKNRSLNIHIVVIPTPRSRLFSDLVDGYGDIAAGNLTITPEREKLVDFTDPTMVNVEEIIVSGPGSPEVKSIFDLSGREVIVRKSSSYFESLQALNKTLVSIHKKPVKMTVADEYLEDEDLLEMVNSGVLPFIIIDSHKGEFWAKIFPKIRLHPDLKLRTGGEIAWAMRKHSPKLKKSLNRFIKTIKKGTLTGNILFRRYLQNTGYITSIMSERSRKRYEHTIELFKKYGNRYDFPYLLLTALAYQESGLDQNKKSNAGAIGIMQILPSTARDKNVNIKHIERLENNIHAGTRYLRFMADRYFADPGLTPLNRDLFTIASYNAGPARIGKLRKQAAARGLDPDIWFNNVEVVAAARIGRETVQYVRNIYKYFVAYDYIMKKQKLKKVGSAILRSHYKK